MVTSAGIPNCTLKPRRDSDEGRDATQTRAGKRERQGPGSKRGVSERGREGGADGGVREVGLGHE